MITASTPLRRAGVAGPGGRVAHVGLQPERDQHHAGEEGAEGQAEHHDAHRRSRGGGRPSGFDDRVLGGQLPDREGREADGGDHRQADDHRRAEPVQLLALVEHDLQRADPDHQQAQADVVHRHAPGGRLSACSSRYAADRRAMAATGTLMKKIQRQWALSEMMPPRIGPAIGATTGGHAPQAPWPGAPCPSGRCAAAGSADSGMIGPPHRPCRMRNAHQHARACGARPQRQREQAEARHAEREHPHRAEPLGQPAGQRHGDRLGHGIGGDHPGALAGRDAQAAGDVRHRDVGDGGVQHRHEVGQPPSRSAGESAAARPSSGRRGWRVAMRTARPQPRRMSMSAFIDRPTRSGCAASSLRIEGDAHRQALDHLDPVAGGVLGRDDREGRAGAAAESPTTRAVELHALAVEVAGQGHRLAEADLAQLRLP